MAVLIKLQLIITIQMIGVLYTYCFAGCQPGIVYNTLIMKKEIRQLHIAIIDLVGLMNRPQQDIALIKEAGITLDRALFPLLVVIDRHDGIGVKELADLVGRDYTTVSRQIAKLEKLKLVARQTDAADRRVNKAVVTKKGNSMIEALNGAREKMGSSILAHWSNQELEDLVKLLRKLTGDLQSWHRQL